VNLRAQGCAVASAPFACAVAPSDRKGREGVNPISANLTGRYAAWLPDAPSGSRGGKPRKRELNGTVCGVASGRAVWVARGQAP
jgi:hypothetical protein